MRQPRQKCQQPPHPIAILKVAVGDDVPQVAVGRKVHPGRVDQNPVQRDTLVVRVRQCLTRVDGAVAGGKHEFPQHGQARAGTADWRASADDIGDGLLDRRVLPQPDVVPLVTALNEERIGMADAFDRGRVEGSVSRLEDQGLDGSRVGRGKVVIDVAVIFVFAVGADHDKTTPARLGEQPGERRIDFRGRAIGRPTNQRQARRGWPAGRGLCARAKVGNVASGH